MNIRTILLVIVIIIILYMIIQWWTTDSTALAGQAKGTEEVVIKAEELPAQMQPNNFTYSIWFYVDNWNYKFGEKKYIYARGSTEVPCPSVSLGAQANNLVVDLAVYPNPENNNAQKHSCKISNVPLQKWVNLLISVYGRSLDVYIDGKLVRTCVLPGVAKVDAQSDIYRTPQGGFDGWTANFKFWPDATNPQEAWDIYKEGYGGSVLGNFFNKYRIKVAFLEDNQEKGSFEI